MSSQLNMHYELEMTGSEYDNLWEDSNNKTDLKANALKSVDDWHVKQIREIVRKKLGNAITTTNRNPEYLQLKSMMGMSNYCRQTRGGDFRKIDSTTKLAAFFRDAQDAPN